MLAKDAEAHLVQYPGAIKYNLRYWISRVLDRVYFNRHNFGAEMDKYS